MDATMTRLFSESCGFLNGGKQILLHLLMTQQPSQSSRWTTVLPTIFKGANNHWKRKEGMWLSWLFLSLQGSHILSCLSSPFPSMPLHPRGPDRHPTITPSHEPRAVFFFFFHIPRTRFLSILTVQQKWPEGRRERDKRTEIVRERRGRPERSLLQQYLDSKRDIVCLTTCMGGDGKAQTSSWQTCPVLLICTSRLLPRRQHVSPPTNLRVILAICWLSHLPNRLHSTKMCPLICVSWLKCGGDTLVTSESQFSAWASKKKLTVLTWCTILLPALKVLFNDLHISAITHCSSKLAKHFPPLAKSIFILLTLK